MGVARMKWKVISASVRGSSHQRSGLPNQDAVDSSLPGKGEPAAAVIAVSDGHGSARHFRSHIGSTLAVHVAVTTVSPYLDSVERRDLDTLSRQLVDTWLAAVRKDLEHNAFTEEELAALDAMEGEAARTSVTERPELAYGATLLLAAVSDDRIVYMQLGDGDVLAISTEGVTTRPIPEDARLVANQTTSLCQPEAWREFRVAELEGAAALPAMVLLSTDGYVNSFRSEDDFLQIGADYLKMLREHGADGLAQELPKILSEATEQGSGDDITLGVLHQDGATRRPTPINERERIREAATRPSQTIRELRAERSAQQRKLDELTERYGSSRRQALQLRIVAGIALLFAILALTHRFWLPILRANSASQQTPGAGPGRRNLRPQPDDPADPSGTHGGKNDPAKPVVGGHSSHPPSADTWALMLDDGRTLPIFDGLRIAADDIHRGAGKKPYARVQREDKVLKLINLSDDVWTVTPEAGGPKKSYRQNERLTLNNDFRIAFGKLASGSLHAHPPEPPKAETGEAN